MFSVITIVEHAFAGEDPTSPGSLELHRLITPAALQRFRRDMLARLEASL